MNVQGQRSFNSWWGWWQLCNWRLTRALWRPVWRGRKPKGDTQLSLTLRPYSPVLWRVCRPPRGEMQSRRQQLSPSLLATIRKQNHFLSQGHCDRLALRLWGPAFPCQGVPTGNFKVCIKDWWMLFLSSSTRSNSVCSCGVFLCRRIHEKNIIMSQNTLREKKLLPHHPFTSHPRRVPVLTVADPCVQATGNSGSDPGSMPATLCSLKYNHNCLAKERPQESLSLQRSVLLIFEHCGGLESDFSVPYLCVYTEKHSLESRKLHLNWSARKNKRVSCVKPDDERNDNTEVTHLWHHTHFVSNDLLRFKLCYQPNLTQTTACSPPQRDGEEKEPLTAHYKNCSTLQFTEKGGREGGRD